MDHQHQWTSLPQHSGKVALAALVFSLLFHLITGGYISGYAGRHSELDFHQTREPVKIRIVDKKDMKAHPKDPEMEEFKKMIEMPQLKTERPDQARFVGNVDHKTEKETKLPDNIKREKAANAGVKGNPNATAKEKKAEVKENKPQPQPMTAAATVPKMSIGSVAFDSGQRKPRNEYERMLPTQAQDLAGQVDAGYQDYIDDKIDEGDRIDINTSEYRYIGYFTSMRKAIELVWIYPDEAARRGMQGVTILEFAIDKSGRTSRIRVLKSSGYEILDRNMVDTIRMASPFSPLPPGFKKNRIIVTGAFTYVLNAFGSH